MSNCDGCCSAQSLCCDGCTPLFHSKAIHLDAVLIRISYLSHPNSHQSIGRRNFFYLRYEFQHWPTSGTPWQLLHDHSPTWTESWCCFYCGSDHVATNSTPNHHPISSVCQGYCLDCSPNWRACTGLVQIVCKDVCGKAPCIVRNVYRLPWNLSNT